MDFGIVQREQDPEDTPSFLLKRASNPDFTMYEEKRVSKRMQREVSVYNQDDSVVKKKVIDLDISTKGKRIMAEISAFESNEGASPKNKKNITCYQLDDTYEEISGDQ